MVVAFRTSKSVFENSGCNEVNCTGDIVKINNTWEIFSKNDFAIREDFKLLTKARKSEPISDSNFIQGNKEDIFIEEGAKVEFAFLNTLTGPIYIGKQAVVMEGSKI